MRHPIPFPTAGLSLASRSASISKVADDICPPHRIFETQASQRQRFSSRIYLAPLVGQEKGFFAQHGLDIELVYTVNSIRQMTGLIDGAFDIAMTAIDNVIAYMEGQGEAVTTNKPDIVSVMGSSSGFLSLIVAPHIRSFEDLKGTTLSVDAMTTGYAFTLRRMLAMRGLNEHDYRLVKVGGMKERYEALTRNEQVGTLMVPPFTLMARDKGFNELETVLNVMKHFQGGVAAARREWLAIHQDEVIGFIRGNLAALEWLYEPANKAQALEIFMAHMNNTSHGLAEQSYAVLLNPLSGFPRRADADLEGVETVIDIRRTYAEPRRPLSEASAYYDPSYYSRALQTRVMAGQQHCGLNFYRSNSRSSELCARFGQFGRDTGKRSSLSIV